MNYINIRQVHRLVGTNYPLGAVSFAHSLDEYLQYLSSSGDQLPDTLLRHNLIGNRQRTLCVMAKIDADIVFELDIANKSLNRTLKDYRIHKEFARCPEEQRVVLHLYLSYPDKTKWVIHIPLQALMKGFGDPEEGYQCYSHGICLVDESGNPIGEESYYCGITSRNWLKRMAEHFREIKGGSNKLFHRAWRDYQGRSDVVLNSELIVLNHSFQGAMAWEEWIVDRYMAEKRSLNMICGGFKGLRQLHKLGYLSKQEASNEERDIALLKYAKEHPKAGIPNLFIAGLWEDDQFYAKVIGNRPNTLSREQIQRIRSLASLQWTLEDICTEVGARNIEQVRKVIQKKIYSRMY